MTPEQDQALLGNKIKLLGRGTISPRTRRGDHGIRQRRSSRQYSLAWNGVMDLDAAVVLDDAEARALAKG